MVSSWTIGNKEVASITIGNKEVQSIVRVSDSKVLYEKAPSYSISLVADKYTANTGETVTFTATVLDGNNQPVSGETVTFTDGTNVLGTATTNASGICSVSYSWEHTNSLNIHAVYATVESNNVSITITQPISKIDTQIISSHGFYLQDINGNPLSGKTVHFAIFGTKYTVVTSSNGLITENGWASSITFDGDDEYNGCSYP